MGDRGNIVMVDRDNKQVWFYTHWKGSEIREIAQKALARKVRWTDHAYLARIVFDTLVGKEAGSETGFGISTGVCDNEHDIVVIDTKRQRVGLVKEKSLVDGQIPRDVPLEWTFDEFIKQEFPAAVEE